MRRNPLLFFLSGQNLAGPPGTGWSPQTSPVPDVLGRHGIDHLDWGAGCEAVRSPADTLAPACPNGAER